MAIPDGLLSCAWTAAWAVAAPAFFGLGVLRALGLPAGAGARVSWAFALLAGQFLLAPATALWLWCGQPVPGIVVPVLGAGVGLWLLRRTPPRPAGAPAAPRGNSGFLLTAVTALVVLLFVRDCLIANVAPIRFGDEAQIWAAKAKALYAAPAVDLPLALGVVEHADYPNLNPLAQVLSFAAAGRVLHFENRLPLQAFGVVLLLLLSAGAGRRAPSWCAAAVVLAVSGTLATGNATAAYSDVPLAAAALAVVEALLRWRETGARVWWRVACLMLGLLLAIKNEGAMLAVAIAAPALLSWCCDRGPDVARPRVPRRELAWLLVPLATVSLHQVWNGVHGLRNDLLDPNLAGGRGIFVRVVDQAGTHGPQVLGYFGRMLVDPGVHRLLPLLCLAAAAAAWWHGGSSWLRGPAAMVAGSVAAAVAGYALVFTGTHADLAWHLATAAARTVEHVVPIAALGLCLAIGRQPPAAGS